jgi:hypothetical protein
MPAFVGLIIRYGSVADRAASGQSPSLRFVGHVAHPLAAGMTADRRYEVSFESLVPVGNAATLQEDRAAAGGRPLTHPACTLPGVEEYAREVRAACVYVCVCVCVCMHVCVRVCV